MSTTGTEKHCRLCLMLSKGGTKACHHLLLKRIKELSPKDHQPYPWTVQQFLEDQKKTIKKSKISKDKLNILFPVTGDTDLSKWDLSLYCTVLLLYCQLPYVVHLDIKQFQTLRNNLCHMNEPTVTDSEFKDKLETIKVIIDRIVEKTDDPNLKTEMENIKESLETEPLSLGESHKEMHKFYSMEIDIREKLEHVEERILNKMEQLDNKCELISKKFDQNSNANMIMARNNVLVPGVNIFLDLKNISDDEEENMSAVLCQLFEEVINEDEDFKSSIPADSHVKLREVSKKTFHRFLSKGWKIVSAKHECIQLHIKCISFKSLADLFREQIHGQLDELITDLKEALNECVVGRELCMETTIYKDEFWNVLEKSISSVDEFITMCTTGSSNSNDNGQKCPEGRKPTLTLSAINVRSQCDQEDCISELDSCLQSFKTDLESELEIQNIRTSTWTNASQNNDETDRKNESNKNGSEEVALTQTVDKLHNLSLTNKEHHEQLDVEMEGKEENGEKCKKNKSTEEVDSKIVKDAENEEDKESTDKTEKGPSLATMYYASKYSKEDSAVPVGKVMEQSALDGINDALLAVSCYLELAYLTLFDSHLKWEVFDAAEEMKIVDMFVLAASFRSLAFYMKEHILHYGLPSDEYYYISPRERAVHKCKAIIEIMSRSIQCISERTKNIIGMHESVAETWKSADHFSKESRESYDQLQKLCVDEELCTQKLERELELSLYGTYRGKSVQALSSPRKQFSKNVSGDEYGKTDDRGKKRVEVLEVPTKTEMSPHSMHDISKHDDKKYISVKPKLLDVQTEKEEMKRIYGDMKCIII